MSPRFCHSCGARLGEPIGSFCRNCGAEIGDGGVADPATDPPAASEHPEREQSPDTGARPGHDEGSASGSPASPGPPHRSRARLWPLALIAVVALIVAGVILLTGLSGSSKKSGGGADSAGRPDPTQPDGQGDGGTELVYRGEPTGEAQEVTDAEMEESIAIIRKRAAALGLRGAVVSRQGVAEIKVDLPDGAPAGGATEALGRTSQLYFFDWEPNLIGPQRVIGGHPGQSPPDAALEKLEMEWKEAGRNTKSFESRQLIASGAYPDAYTAALLAAEQEPVEDCERCSVGRTQYYLFEDHAPHRLLAGPETVEKDLYESPTGEGPAKDGIVVEVPAGTIVVSELPVDELGKVDETVQPGWFALKDDPALSGGEITEPKQEYAQGTGEPDVTFKFTDEGQEHFQEVTRQIARRGQVQAVGPVSREMAAALSGHFAVILDDEVKTRPIINFTEDPDGIDGRQGAQISGGFSGVHGLEEAQELARTLQIGAPPIELHLIRDR